MKKESKANLIFVIVLIGTMIPGITMLVRKKLNGDHTSAMQPDPVPDALAYNQPPPTPPGLQRIEPQFVREWVQGIVRDKITSEVPMLRGPDGPVISDGYVTQALVTTSFGTDSESLWLLVWRDGPVTQNDPVITKPDGETMQFASATPIEIPKEVRHTLQNVGYIDPPPRAWLGCWKTHGPIAKSLKLNHADGKPPAELLTLP